MVGNGSRLRVYNNGIESFEVCEHVNYVKCSFRIMQFILSTISTSYSKSTLINLVKAWQQCSIPNQGRHQKKKLGWVSRITKKIRNLPMNLH